MRRNKALKRGRQHRNDAVRFRIIPVVVAGGIGYLLGGFNSTTLRDVVPSAAEAVAVRFPDTSDTSANASSARIAAAAARRTTGAAELALFSPEPMVPQVNAQRSAPAADRQVPIETAALDAGGSPPVAEMATPVQTKPQPAAAKPVAVLPPRASDTKPTAVRRPVANRPGYMLNDAQIASIKQRLNLTPDQEQMWPAVEVALRNMAYAHAQPARGWSVPETQSAAVDPNAVQGLKSAASPLIMSFNAEQKEQVRNLIHVMGLDQLASEF
jgi:hypothetical protein